MQQKSLKDFCDFSPFFFAEATSYWTLYTPKKILRQFIDNLRKYVYIPKTPYIFMYILKCLGDLIEKLYQMHGGFRVNCERRGRSNISQPDLSSCGPESWCGAMWN